MLEINEKITGTFQVETIIDIYQDEYIILKKGEKKNDKIIGLFTDGLLTCSMILISFNQDEIIFFSHIDEKSDIIKIIKENLIVKLSGINIKTIDIHYTKGIDSIKNNEINYDSLIDEIILIFNKSLDKKEAIIINRTLKEHNFSISCLKIFNPSNFMRIINHQIKNYQEAINKFKEKEEIKVLYEKGMEMYIKDINNNLNIFYYYDHEKLLQVLEKLKINLRQRKK